MLQGNWWVPGREDQSVPGVLSLTGGDIGLQVTGELLDNQRFGEFSHIEKICGVTSQSTDMTEVEAAIAGKIIFLQNCLQTGRNTSLGSSVFQQRIPTSTFSAVAAYVADNKQSLRDTSLTFHEIKVGLTHLPDFALTEGRLIRDDHIPNGNGGTDGLDASFRFRSLPEASINGVKLEFLQGFSSHGDRIRRYVIEPSIHLKLRSPIPLSISQWQHQYVTPLQHLLTLATAQKNYVNEIQGFHDMNTETLEFPDLEQPITLPISFNILSKEVLEAANTEVSEPFFLLFKLGDIKDHLQEVLQQWFSLYEKHRPVQNLLFGIIYASEIYAEDRFLNLARALEIYHRSNYPGGLMPKAEFKALRKEIISQVEKKHQKWLGTKLTWANELTLQDRLVKLMSGDCNLLAQDLGFSPEALGTQIRIQRNRLTHYGDEKRKVAATELTWLSYFMEYLLQTLLLTEIGFSVETIRKERQYRFRMGEIKKSLSRLINTDSQETPD